MARFVPHLLIALGAMFALVALASLGQLSSGFDPEWRAVGIEDLESGKAPGADFVRIADGHLFWPGMYLAYDEHLRTKETRDKGIYVPVVSANLAQELEQDLRAGEALDLGRVSTFLFLPQALVDREFGGATSPEAIGSVTTRFAVEGLMRPATEMPAEMREALTQDTPGLALGGVHYVSQGIEPVTLSSALIAAFLALALLVSGFRRRARARAGRVAAQQALALPGLTTTHV